MNHSEELNSAPATAPATSSAPSSGSAPSPAPISQSGPTPWLASAPWHDAAQGAQLLDDSGRPGTTIFEEMTALANRHDAINLGQGFPDEEGPAEIRDRVIDAIRGGANQYAPGKGLPVLRQAVSAHQKRFYDLDVNADTDVVITTGATEAIAAAILALVSPGDEVVTFEPFYDSYAAMIPLAGGVHRTIALQRPDFLPDLDRMEESFSARTRVIVLNNPHNPFGTVFDARVLERVVELAIKYDAVILSDEVYEHLRFGVPHIPVATLPGAFDRTLTISSAGKTFSFTGWKIGWASGPARLVDAVRTVKQFLSYSSGTPFQAAIAHGLGASDEAFAGFASSLRLRRDLLAEGLRAAGFTVFEPAGTYFITVDTLPLGFPDAATLARALPGAVGVAGIPIAAFCHDAGAAANASLLRFAFCKKEVVLREASSRLAGLGAALGS